MFTFLKLYFNFAAQRNQGGGWLGVVTHFLTLHANTRTAKFADMRMVLPEVRADAQDRAVTGRGRCGSEKEDREGGGGSENESRGEEKQGRGGGADG